MMAMETTSRAVPMESWERAQISSPWYRAVRDGVRGKAGAERITPRVALEILRLWIDTPLLDGMIARQLALPEATVTCVRRVLEGPAGPLLPENWRALAAPPPPAGAAAWPAWFERIRSALGADAERVSLEQAGRYGYYWYCLVAKASRPFGGPRQLAGLDGLDEAAWTRFRNALSEARLANEVETGDFVALVERLGERTPQDEVRDLSLRRLAEDRELVAPAEPPWYRRVLTFLVDRGPPDRGRVTPELTARIGFMWFCGPQGVYQIAEQLGLSYSLVDAVITALRAAQREGEITAEALRDLENRRLSAPWPGGQRVVRRINDLGKVLVSVAPSAPAGAYEGRVVACDPFGRAGAEDWAAPALVERFTSAPTAQAWLDAQAAQIAAGQFIPSRLDERCLDYRLLVRRDRRPEPLTAGEQADIRARYLNGDMAAWRIGKDHDINWDQLTEALGLGRAAAAQLAAADLPFQAEQIRLVAEADSRNQDILEALGRTERDAARARLRAFGADLAARAWEEAEWPALGAWREEDD